MLREGVVSYMQSSSAKPTDVTLYSDLGIAWTIPKLYYSNKAMLLLIWIYTLDHCAGNQNSSSSSLLSKGNLKALKFFLSKLAGIWNCS